MKWLYVIPARSNSQRIPGKNEKPLGGKPLILYTVEAAREVAHDEDILVSTDSPSIQKIVESAGLSIPLLRPSALSGNHSGMHEVLLHALEVKNRESDRYDGIVLLQPTSPFRQAHHIRAAMQLFQPNLDMVVSVKTTDSNPYFVLYEENDDGFLHKSKIGTFTRSQDCPPVYELNGAIYVIRADSLHQGPISSFKNVRKYLMNDICSIDIDSPLDWLVAEVIQKNGLHLDQNYTIPS